MKIDSGLKLAICSGSFQNDLANRRIGLADVMELAADFGFDAVEIREDLLINKVNGPSLVKTSAADLNLELIYSSLDRVVGSTLERTIDNCLVLKKRVDEAAFLGCSLYKAGFGETDTFDEIIPEQFRYLSELGQYAKDKGVLICLENSDRETGHKPGLFADFFAGMNLPGYGMTYDSGNFLKVGHDPVQAACLLKNYISYIHLKDLKLYEKSSTFLGDGDLALGPLMSAIVANGYRGYICFEFPMSIDRKNEIRSSLDLLQALLAGVKYGVKH